MFCRYSLSVRCDVVIALPAVWRANLFWYKHTGQPKKRGLQQYDALNPEKSSRLTLAMLGVREALTLPSRHSLSSDGSSKSVSAAILGC